MKAICVSHAGNNEQLIYQDCNIPNCGPNDILIQIKAIGINFIDIYLRKGLYPVSQYPYIPGKEGSGIVQEVGSAVKHIKVNDRVAFCSAGSGTYAEYVVLNANEAVLIPDQISFEIAAASLLQGLTAFYLSHLTFPLNNKHIALIHAGAGGVGLLLIQMAKLLQANVITTVSNQDKAKLALAMGANHNIIYTETSFLEAVMKITNNFGVSVCYDAVGQTTFNNSLQALNIRGMLVSYGQASGPIPPFDLSILSQKSLFITRPVLWHYTQGNQLQLMADKLFSLILTNKLKITIGQQYSLAHAKFAHYDLENRKTIGKSLLLV